MIHSWRVVVPISYLSVWCSAPGRPSRGRFKLYACSTQHRLIVVKYKVVWLHRRSQACFHFLYPSSFVSHSSDLLCLLVCFGSLIRNWDQFAQTTSNQDHFDTQSTSYQTQGRIFFALLIITGNGLIPFMVLSAHLSRNQYSKSPIFMNLCYSLIFYSTSLLLS